MSEERPEITVPADRGRMVLLLILGLIMTGGCVFILLIPLREPRSWPVMVPIGLAGLLFFGLCLVYTVYRLFSPKPMLVNNAEGITDNASAIGVGLVPWEEITGLRIYTFMGQKFLAVEVRDMEAILARFGPLKRLWIGLNIKLTGSGINIPSVGLPVTLEKLTAVITAYVEPDMLREER